MNDFETYTNYMVNMEATGKNIRNFMKMTGYTARELEKLIGCTQMTFFNWQEGKNLPSFDNLLRLSGILKTPLEKIVVFNKFKEENLPLKDTNSGFIRNNVFFTYNNATECVIRDCLAFKKKYGVYPTKLLLNEQTLLNWEAHQDEEAETAEVDIEEYLGSIPGKLIPSSLGNPFLTTDFFQVKLVADNEIPEHYYRLINTQD